MKIVVLGANGYIGKFLVNKLYHEEQYKHVQVLPVHRYNINLTNFKAIQNYLTHTEPDIVINAAFAGRYTGLLDEDQYLHTNLAMFMNFFNNKDLFEKFINIGSGAEFDKSQEINSIQEHEIGYHVPKDTYGLTKNIIANLCTNTSKFVTLRLFGCFDSSEPETRLFKRIMSGQEVLVTDKYFDYISLSDFGKIVDHYIACHRKDPSPTDINCVYLTKKTLKEQIDSFLSYHDNIKPNIKYTAAAGLNYTGNGDRLASLGLKLDGLVEGFKEYK